MLASSSQTTEEERRRRPHAIIIGAGIAGCSLALLLKRAGVTSTIYEAYPRERATQGVGGGLQLGPGGMRVLQHLGLAHKVVEAGVPSKAMVVHNQHGKQLAVAEIDPRHEFGQPAVNLTRAALAQVLMEAVEQDDDIGLEFNQRLVDLAGFGEDGDDNAVVTATFEDGHTAQGHLVVGADGIHSRTRAIILQEEDPKPHFEGLMTSGGFALSDVFLDLPEGEQGHIHFLFGPTGGSFGYCRAHPNDPRVVMWWRNMNVLDDPRWAGRAPTRDELQALDTDELKRRILDVPGGWAPLARQLVADTEHILRGTVHDVASLPRWHVGRAVLVGDAAHAVSPHSGLGASLALEDVMYLAKALRLALRDHCATDRNTSTLPTAVVQSAFRLYQAARKERAEAVVAEGRRRGEPRQSGGTQQPPSALKQWVTERFLTALFTYLVPATFRWTYGYRIEWDDCASLVEAEMRLAQARAARPWLQGVASCVVLAAVLAPVFLPLWSSS